MENNRICVIVGASGEPLSQDQILTGGKSFIIAADGGHSRLKELSIEPDVLIGDFDSLAETAPHEAGKILRFPVEKDDTDTMLAVRYGLEHGFRRFLLLCCLGGRRLDHSIATVQTLGFIAGHGGVGIACNTGEGTDGENGEEILLAVKNSRVVFPEGMKGDLSVFSLTGSSVGVDIENLKYSVKNAELTSLFPLGVSNSFIGKSSSVSVTDGVTLIYFRRCGTAYEDLFGFVSENSDR